MASLSTFLDLKLRLPQGEISPEKTPELATCLLGQVSEGTIDANPSLNLTETKTFENTNC